MLKITVLGMVLVLAGAVPAVADTHYVSAGQSIQAAIDDASNGDQIEVAPGTYYEAINFNGKRVRLYSSGGPWSETTINGNGADHVVQCISGEDANTVLDGFTITGGVANGSWPDNIGGGMLNNNHSSPTVTNCAFSGNSAGTGGGMANEGSSPTVTNCMFDDNASSSHGGGMYNEGGSPMVTNCYFIQNTAATHGGGMMNNVSSSSTVANCAFIQNTAGAGGGGMANSVTSSPIVTNCTFTSNTASYGAGMFNYNSHPTITSCILWGDTPDEVNNFTGSSATVTYSDIQGGYSVAGNINADPCFVDASEGVLRLKPNSPCIDAGDSNMLVNAGISQDIEGFKRFVDIVEITNTGSGPLAYVDMGSYEFNWFKKKPLVLNDVNGVPVSFSLSGGGWGEVTGGPAFEHVILHDTGEKSQLTIVTKGKTETSVGDIICYGPLKGISAKNVNLRGYLIIRGPLGTLILNDVADGHTIIIGSSTNPKAAVTIKLDRVSGLALISWMPVKSLTATEWLGGSINAPSVSSITTKGDKKRKIPGDLDVDVEVDNGIGTVKVAGELSGEWDCNTVKSITTLDINNFDLSLTQTPDTAGKILALGSLTVKGHFYGSNIRSAGNIGKVTAGIMTDSNCFAGVTNGITGLPNAEAASFDNTATIKSIAIKGIKKEPAPYYINSNIAAANILSASIVYPQSDNGGEPFGLTADNIKKLTIKKMDGTTTSLKDPKSLWTLDNLEVRLY
jgi:hypothetical protein